MEWLLMLETARNCLNISQRKVSLKENAVIVRDFIKKIPAPSRWQIIEKLQEQLGFSEIEAYEALRYLEDGNEIFIVQDSAVLKIISHLDISSYDQERSKLVAVWLKARETGE